jgi:NRAMP (natural resistance-associated macrophage protein)-like metal ion transporter
MTDSMIPTAATRPRHRAWRLHAVRPGIVHRWLGQLGPGIVTGASDDDPSGIATYSAAGARAGYGFLWTALLSLPMMAVIQDMCGRIGLVTGHGLAAVLQRRFPRVVVLGAVSLLTIANTFNVGADIAAIAAAINLLVPIPVRLLVVPIGGLLLALQALTPYRLIVRVFKWLTLALLAYFFTAFAAHPRWGAVLHGARVPHLMRTHGGIGILVGILGTTISPYLFFWQTSCEVEEHPVAVMAAMPQETAALMKGVDSDIYLGMIYSNVAMFFIILTAGATLHVAGLTDIATASDAAAALKPLVGPLASLVFTIGIIGTGVLAIPILTGSVAYAVAEVFAWPEGLDRRVRDAWRFYGVIGVGTATGVLLTLVGIDPIRALIWAAQLNGIAAPPLMVLLLILCNDRQVMGRYVNGWPKNLIAGSATLLMTTAAVALFTVGG